MPHETPPTPPSEHAWMYKVVPLRLQREPKLIMALDELTRTGKAEFFLHPREIDDLAGEHAPSYVRNAFKTLQERLAERVDMTIQGGVAVQGFLRISMELKR